MDAIIICDDGQFGKITGAVKHFIVQPAVLQK